ncbi:hypothetical protein GY12_13435 [Micrococcus luteus]|nr:hypothetical protein GY12_13435 [Micrococcus luteus]
MRHRIRVQAGGHEAGEVGHVHPEPGPTSSAIERKAAKSSWRGYADQPATITFGRASRAFSRTLSMSMRWVSGSTSYAAML